MPESDSRLRRFRQGTAPLRAAIFATILQQQHAQQAANPDPQGGDSRGRLKRRQSLERQKGQADALLLANAFRVFDTEGKGYISGV